jgi:hypothetical protein
MRDINRAERLLALFTSPNGAAGIVGDLSEERGQRGSVWFWRQVLGTVFSLCRGTLLESPVVVLLLVALGFALSVGVSQVTQVTVLPLPGFHALTSGWVIFLIYALISWPGPLIAGATMVAAAPRTGMVACVLVAGLQGMLALPLDLFVLIVLSQTSPLWWFTSASLATPVLLLLGGAMVRHRQIRKLLRTA